MTTGWEEFGGVGGLPPKDQTITTACTHHFVYAGVRYRDGHYPLPGTGAHRRYYGHVYFCDICLVKKTDLIQNPDHYGRCVWNTYDKLLFNATPASGDEVPLPEFDRQ